MIKASVLMAVGYLLLGTSANADDDAPLGRVRSTVAAVVEVVSRSDLRGDAHLMARRATLRRVADDLFDFREMAQRALGRHWRTPSEGQRAEFLALFTGLLERSYVQTIENYAGERIVFLGETVEGGYATVHSKIVTTRGAEIRLCYRLRKSSADWSAYDIAVDNVSLTANYREQVNRMLSTMTFAGLLDRMRAGEVGAFVVPRGAGKPW